MKTTSTPIPNGYEARTFAEPGDTHPFLVERHTEDADGTHHVVEVYAGGKLVTTASASTAGRK